MAQETKAGGPWLPGPWRIGCWSSHCAKPSHKNGHPGPRGDDPCVYDQHQLLEMLGIASATPGVNVVAVDEFFYDRHSNDPAVLASIRLAAAAPQLVDALSIAEQFMSIAMDWNIDEAEINGEMRDTRDWLEIVRAALAAAGVAK